MKRKAEEKFERPERKEGDFKPPERFLLSDPTVSLHLLEVVRGALQHIVKPHLEGSFIRLERSSYSCENK